MPGSQSLYEPAAPDALLCVGGGKTLYIGSMRIWNRIRAAMRLALGGASFTDAAIGAGFTDSAHFARCFRETFGVTPSYVFGKIARAAAMPETRFAMRA